MLRWALAAIGVVVASMAISVAFNVLSNSSPPQPYDAAAARLASQIDEQYEPVSIVRLLANPDRYDGHKVRAQGWVSLAFEGAGLHADEVAYKAGLLRNAIWIDRPRWLSAAATPGLDRRYAEVAGTFSASEHGHMSAYAASLTQVSRIQPTWTRADFHRWMARERDQMMLTHLFSVPILTLLGWLGLIVVWACTRNGSPR